MSNCKSTKKTFENKPLVWCILTLNGTCDAEMSVVRLIDIDEKYETSRQISITFAYDN